jgi:hypothetical protein
MSAFSAYCASGNDHQYYFVGVLPTLPVLVLFTPEPK